MKLTISLTDLVAHVGHEWLDDFETLGWAERLPGGVVRLSREAVERLSISPEVVSHREVDVARVRDAKRNWEGDLRCDTAGLPYPSVFLGLSLIWDAVPRPHCPACKDIPLRSHEYCLRCDSWGMDGGNGIEFEDYAAA